MTKVYTPVFDINKQMPYKYQIESPIIVKFSSSYSVYLQNSLEPNFLLLETELLARFKRVMYDGRIAPSSEIYQIALPSYILTILDPEGDVSFIDIKNNLMYWVEGKYLEELHSEPINFIKFIEEEKPIIISEKTFAEEIIEHYKLDNLYNTKLMKIYSSTYFDGYSQIQQEKLPVDSLIGDIENDFSTLQEDQ